MFKKIIFCVAIGLTAIACKDSNVDGGTSGAANVLLSKQTPGLYNEDKSLFIYDNDLHQYAFNTQRHSFRIQNASQSRYLSCVLDTDPVVNKYVTATLKTQGISSFPSQELEVQVLKKTGGKVWLWNKAQKIGLVIQLE